MLTSLFQSFDAPLTPDSCRAMRCDEVLEMRVRHALNALGCAPLRQIHVSVEDGRVVLSGYVPTYYLKQLAQAAAMSLEGVESLDNDISVC